MSTTVPETYLKRKARVQRRENLLKQRAERMGRLAETRDAAEQKRKQRAKETQEMAFKRAEKYVAEYRQQRQDLIRLKREAKKNNSVYVEPEAKVVLVVRIRGINRMAPKTRKILQLLRLRQIHNAVFVRVNAATLSMLRLVEPYVAYGYPTLSTVRKMLYKRGHGKVNGQRVALTDNETIREALGKFDIVCMEDLVHEIVTCGPNFKPANNFLWPFKLASPKGGFNMKRRHFVEGGDYGNRERFINQFVARMN